MNKEKEIQRQKDLKRIKSLRLIDDDFMTICFDNYIEGAELLLKIILDRDDLKVSEVKAQKALKNCLKLLSMLFPFLPIILHTY